MKDYVEVENFRGKRTERNSCREDNRLGFSKKLGAYACPDFGRLRTVSCWVVRSRQPALRQGTELSDAAIAKPA